MARPKRKAWLLNLLEQSAFVLGIGEIGVDPARKEIRVGDGLTPGGTVPDSKVWKLTSASVIDAKRPEVGDFVITDANEFLHIGDEGTEDLDYTDEVATYGWTEVTLNNGWALSSDASNKARVRRDGNMVTIDAVLSKTSRSNYSPFTLPKWARPKYAVNTVIEANQSQGAVPIKIYPDGHFHLRRSRRNLSRVSIQLSYWVIDDTTLKTVTAPEPTPQPDPTPSNPIDGVEWWNYW